MLLSIFYPTKNQEKKREKIENKIQNIKDIHEKSLEYCLSWWWRTKVTNEKVRGPKRIKLTKLATQFWLTRGPIGENIFICGKKI